MRGWAMKGVFTLGIYVAIGITGAAFGQSGSVHPMDPPPQSPIAPSALMAYPLPIPPGWKTIALTPTPDPPLAPEKVVMTRGDGGSLNEHQLLFARYRLGGTKVELRGPCYSACTVITS